MTRMDGTVDHHASMEDVAGQSTAGSPPPSSIRTAVQEFVTTFTQASRELAGAGERFTREVLHGIQDERSRAEQAAVTSSEKAEQARHAADEVRATASSLHAAAQVLLEQARTTVHESAEQASIDQVTR